MHVMSRPQLLPALLLLAGAPLLAVAESPMPDPIPPAVIGRPLDQIRPVRPKPMATTKPAAKTKQVATTAPQPARKPAAAQAVASPLAQDASAHVGKQALDDRVDPRAVLGNVGEGTHFARKALAEGAYFSDRHRAAVRQYYASHPASGAPSSWRIGETVPSGIALASVPQGLLAKLPALPPGHRYGQLGGEVVLVAEGSKMVVDGISRK